MKKILKQFGKNEEGSGLKNILSLIYHKKNKVEMIFNTNSGIKQIDIEWKTKRVKNKLLKGYSYTIPKSISSSNVEQVVFETSQEDLLSNLITTLIRMGFKDKQVMTKTNKESTVKQIFNESKLDIDSSDDLENIDFDNLKRKSIKTNYKLGIIELFHKIFNENKSKKIYWPNDIKYEKIHEKSKVMLSSKIAKVHKFKKLMGNTILDYPLEELVDFNISSSSFNIIAKGLQYIVLELADGNLIETKQFRNKVLVSEGVIRIPHLYGELTKEVFLELKKNNIIEKKEIYVKDKIYKISFSNVSGQDMPLVNPIIEKIPQDEIIDLAWSIEELKIKQTVYNRKIKELRSKTNSFTTFAQSENEHLYSDLSIHNGIFSPKIEESKEKKGNGTLNRKISISIVKFPKTLIEKTESERISQLVNLEKDVNKLLEMLDRMVKEVEVIKYELAKNRYKLNLIKYTYFINGFSDKLNYKKEKGTDTYITLKESKAAGVVGPKESVLLETKDKNKMLKIEVVTSRS